MIQLMNVLEGAPTWQWNLTIRFSSGSAS